MLNRFKAGTEVTPDLLKAERMVDKKKVYVKILGDGDLKHPLTVKAHAFSKSAIEKIKKAGGQANEIRPAPAVSS
jgi:large subunit ribosomal protein L15